MERTESREQAVHVLAGRLRLVRHDRGVVDANQQRVRQVGQKAPVDHLRCKHDWDGRELQGSG